MWCVACIVMYNVSSSGVNTQGLQFRDRGSFPAKQLLDQSQICAATDGFLVGSF